MNDFIPKWHRELEIFSKVKNVIVLEGNILDVYTYPKTGSIEKGSILRLPEYLHCFFKDAGYQHIAFYDNMQGFYNNMEDECIQSFGNLVKRTVNEGHIKADFSNKNEAPDIIKNALLQTEKATVIVMNLASRYITSPDNMQQSEIESFTSLLLSSLEAREVNTKQGRLKNLLVITVNRLSDIPTWFYHDNPSLKTIFLSPPSNEERGNFIDGSNFSLFFHPEILKEDCLYFRDKPEELQQIKDKFVALTDGFSLTELNALRKLCKNERIHMSRMCDVIDLYKYGIKENPWASIKYEDLEKADSDFKKRVKGQDLAISKTLDVVKRSAVGISGFRHSPHNKPKGILFFAGPTGTGKTETAKVLSEKLFGDESRCKRFDMSEYGQSHSDQRLFGAPPGYVGYEEGGQLTNYIKENPFSILLFDEIEKAHPSVLDKFLQILEDGRMTDGHGETVYFSECIIIFTSNLGIYIEDEYGKMQENVNPDMDYPTLQKEVRKAIEEYFKLKLGRPEILNRIGENIIVFDYIRPSVAKLILQNKVERMIDYIYAEKKISLTVLEPTMDILLQKSLDNLSNGARGIENILESMLLNPLSRYLFDNKIERNSELVLRNITLKDNVFEVNITKQGE